MLDLTIDFNIQKATRENYRKLLQPLSIDQLNFIPAGFNNNLIWNFCHIVVTQQLLVYGLSNTPMLCSPEEISLFRKGSKPEKFYDQKVFDKFIAYSSDLHEQMKQDWENQMFGEYKEYTTSYGYTNHSVHEAIRFNNAHEALHLGSCLAICKSL